MRRWQERAPWQHEADGQGEPSRVARSEFTYEGSLQHEIGRDKPAVGCQQRPQQAGRNPVRRVRHNPERPAGQPDRGGVRVHHGNARESLAEDTDSSRVQLHGDHPRPARTRCAVSAPSPAPMSNTSSPGRTAAALTTRAAHSSWSRCQPHARRDRPRADTTYRHCVDAHAPDRSPPPALRSINFSVQATFWSSPAPGLWRRPHQLRDDVGRDDPLDPPGSSRIVAVGEPQCAVASRCKDIAR